MYHKKLQHNHKWKGCVQKVNTQLSNWTQNWLKQEKNTRIIFCNCLDRNFLSLDRHKGSF